MTHNPKIKGSKCDTGMMSVKNGQKMIQGEWLYPSGMVVENLTHNSKVEGSNEAKYTRLREYSKACFLIDTVPLTQW